MYVCFSNLQGGMPIRGLTVLVYIRIFVHIRAGTGLCRCRTLRKARPGIPSTSAHAFHRVVKKIQNLQECHKKLLKFLQDGVRNLNVCGCAASN